MPKKRNKKKTYCIPHQADFTLAPNQHALRVHKPNYGAEGIPFNQLGIEEIYEASRSMTEAEFKVYMYMASNKDTYMKGLSPADIKKKTGVSRSSYYRARDGLVELGVHKHHARRGFLCLGRLLYQP